MKIRVIPSIMHSTFKTTPFRENNFPTGRRSKNTKTFLKSNPFKCGWRKVFLESEACRWCRLLDYRFHLDFDELQRTDKSSNSTPRWIIKFFNYVRASSFIFGAWTFFFFENLVGKMFSVSFFSLQKLLSISFCYFKKHSWFTSLLNS